MTQVTEIDKTPSRNPTACPGIAREAGARFNRHVSTDYALAPHVRARIMGVFLVAVGGLVCLVAVAVFTLELPLAVMSSVVLLVLASVFAMGYLLTRRSSILSTDDHGYRVRFVRGAGVATGRWSEVEDLVTADVAGAPCVVLRLRGGGTTTIPVGVLAADREEFVRDLRRQLDRARAGRRTG